MFLKFIRNLKSLDDGNDKTQKYYTSRGEHSPRLRLKWKHETPGDGVTQVRVVPVNSRLRDIRLAPLSSLCIYLSLSPSLPLLSGQLKRAKFNGRTWVFLTPARIPAWRRGRRASRRTRWSPGRAQRVSGFRANTPEADCALRTHALRAAPRRAFPLSPASRRVATLRVGIVGRRSRCRRCIDREASSAARPLPPPPPFTRSRCSLVDES